MVSHHRLLLLWLICFSYQELLLKLFMDRQDMIFFFNFKRNKSLKKNFPKLFLWMGSQHKLRLRREIENKGFTIIIFLCLRYVLAPNLVPRDVLFFFLN